MAEGEQVLASAAAQSWSLLLTLRPIDMKRKCSAAATLSLFWVFRNNIREPHCAYIQAFLLDHSWTQAFQLNIAAQMAVCNLRRTCSTHPLLATLNTSRLTLAETHSRSLHGIPSTDRNRAWSQKHKLTGLPAERAPLLPIKQICFSSTQEHCCS